MRARYNSKTLSFSLLTSWASNLNGGLCFYTCTSLTGQTDIPLAGEIPVPDCIHCGGSVFNTPSIQESSYFSLYKTSTSVL